MIVIIFLIIGTLIVFLYRNSYNEIQERYASNLFRIVSTASLKISGDEHSKITSNADTDQKYFKEVKGYLNQIKELNSLTHETIYTFRLHEQRLFWAVMLHEKPFIGEEYKPSQENKQIIREVMQGNYRQSKVYEDENGHWISAFAPIFNSKRKVVGILEADYKLNKFLNEVNNKFFRILLVAGAIFLFGIFIMMLITKQIAKPIKLLTEAVEKVRAGEYNLQLKIDTKDEIGDLEKSFNEMALSLGERFYMLKYISEHTKTMIQKVVKNEISDKGEYRQAVILFSDIRGFTEYSSIHSPEKVVDMLNFILGAKADAVDEFGGHIDKFIGDAVMAVFDKDDKVPRAIQAAVKIHNQVEKLSLKVKEGITLKVGIGISMGEVIFGNIGSEARRDFTTIGSEVNLASRLCSYALPSQTLISKKVLTAFQELPESHNYVVEAIGDIKLKGFGENMQAFSVQEKLESIAHV